MASNQKKPNTPAAPQEAPKMPVQDPALLAKMRKDAALAQARARSMARAQRIADAQAQARAQADARIRAMMMEEEGISPEEAPVTPTESTQATPEAPVEPTQDAPVSEPVAEEAPAPQTAPEEEPAPIAQEAPKKVAVDPRSAGGEDLEYAIQIRNLYKSYGQKQVLKGLNLDVYPGELFGFIGRNGIGKSTTIDCMIGAKRFNSGEISVGGYDIKREPLDAKYSYGYVASEPTCYDVMTGYDYLEFVASIYGLTETEFTGNYKYLCNRLQLNIAELSNHVSGYSHGMKQKLCLVASLLHNPNIWILDEPTVGLDIMAQEELKKMMREYANHGRTVFVTSHNIELVSMLCDRVAIINDGVVKAVYDLNREPQKRAQLSRLFIETYGG